VFKAHLVFVLVDGEDRVNRDAADSDLVARNCEGFEVGARYEQPATADVVELVGDEAVGVVSASFYSAAFGSESNKRFVEAMQKNYGVLPGGYSAGMYIAGQCVEAALQALGGKGDDRKALAEALHQISVADTPRGPIKFDQYGNVVGDVFIRRCERKGGQLVNTIIKTYPRVSQFWTYDEKAFLANPVYTRDYPPAKNLEN
jgi:branched-chain amino acid transport system substrate-binding protein